MDVDRLRQAVLRIWRAAARLDVAAVILGVLVVLLAVGSTLPQPGGDAATGYFGAPWLLLAWAFLLAATLGCTLQRWRRLVRADRAGLARLATLVTHLAVFVLLGGVLVETQLGWRTEVTVPPGATVAVGQANGLRVAADGIDIERYPDGSVADYVVALRVDDSPATLRLNAPVVREGVAITLRGFRWQPEGAEVTLLAAYAPGYAWLVVGGFLLFAGMSVTVTLAGMRSQ